MHLAQDRHPRGVLYQFNETGINTGIQLLKYNGSSIRDFEDDAYKDLLNKLCHFT